MARWRERHGRIEPPEWYRNYHPEAWDTPDEHELRMMAGNLGLPWPAELHRMHAERRWAQAKYAYEVAHPAFATQEFDALIESARERHAGQS